DGVVLLPEATALGARRQRIFLGRQVALVIVRTLAEMQRRGRQLVPLADLPVGIGIEVLVMRVFHVEGAVGLQAAVGERRGQIAIGALVREMLTGAVLVAE